MYWYWYLKVRYWYLDHWYWYWYWYLFVEYLIQDCYIAYTYMPTYIYIHMYANSDILLCVYLC